MIINTGQRTDIPAFYSDWFANRLRDGYVLVRNPYNTSRITRYRLTPDVVDVIGFCTKNPSPMFRYMDLLSPFRQFWYVTITPYRRNIEPNLKPKSQILEDFRTLSKKVGIDSIGWRYDPIIVNDEWPVERHIEAYRYMAEYLSGYTRISVISFIDLYEKTRRNYPEVREVSREDRLLLGKEMASIASRCGMTLKPCAEGDTLSAYGADCSGCMTVDMYEKAAGQRLRVPRYSPSRKSCACYLSADIGAYNTCGHLCRYCYANYDEKTVKRNMALHDPLSPLLIGHVLPGDSIYEAAQESWRDDQLSLDI